MFVVRILVLGFILSIFYIIFGIVRPRGGRVAIISGIDQTRVVMPGQSGFLLPFIESVQYLNTRPTEITTALGMVLEGDETPSRLIASLVFQPGLSLDQLLLFSSRFGGETLDFVSSIVGESLAQVIRNDLNLSGLVSENNIRTRLGDSLSNLGLEIVTFSIRIDTPRKSRVRKV